MTRINDNIEQIFFFFPLLCFEFSNLPNESARNSKKMSNNDKTKTKENYFRREYLIDLQQTIVLIEMQETLKKKLSRLKCFQNETISFCK